MSWHRKHRWLGHVLRHDNLLHDIIEGKMFGKATQGYSVALSCNNSAQEGTA